MANAGKQRPSANSTQRRAQAKHAGDKKFKSAKGRNVKARLAELTAELNSQAAELRIQRVNDVRSAEACVLRVLITRKISSQSRVEPAIQQVPVGDLADILRGL